MRPSRLLILLLLFAVAPAVSAADPRKPPDMPLSATERNAVLDISLQKIRAYYVSRSEGERIAQALQAFRDKGRYDAIGTAEQLVPKLNADMLEISHDPHLRLGYSYEETPIEADDHVDTPAERESDRKGWAARNYGLTTAKMLDGNIGYLEINGFAEPGFAADTLDAALSFLHDTDALIIDLRRSGGGSPDMVARMVSYFLPGDPVHLSDLHVGHTDQTRQFWTLPLSDRLRYLGRPVYILTSKAVFSAAEGFSYDMQALKRATVVGETTRGGANPGKFYSVDPHFAIYVPTGSVTSAITGGNWESKGVKPDVAVSADQSLPKAQSLALQAVLAATTDPDRRQELSDLLKALPGQP